VARVRPLLAASSLLLNLFFDVRIFAITGRQADLLDPLFSSVAPIAFSTSSTIPVVFKASAMIDLVSCAIEDKASHKERTVHVVQFNFDINRWIWRNRFTLTGSMQKQYANCCYSQIKSSPSIDGFSSHLFCSYGVSNRGLCLRRHVLPVESQSSDRPTRGVAGRDRLAAGIRKGRAQAVAIVAGVEGTHT